MEAGPERARPDPSLYRRASQGDPEAWNGCLSITGPGLRGCGLHHFPFAPPGLL
jgi:hypothetical protein